MKSRLLALAVAAPVFCAAHAQTNVTIYGVADAGFARTDTGTTEPVWGVNSGQQSGSRVGFRGTEDLGGGYSAFFVLENGYLMDTGASLGGLLFGRQAFLGLKTQAGSIKLGRQYTPIYNAHVVVDPFGTNLAGNIGNVFNAYGFRMDNTVNYSHIVGPVSGEIAYGFGEQAGSLSAASQFGGSVQYTQGPLQAVVSYHRAKPVTGTGDTVFAGGVYDARVVKAHFALAQNEAENAAGATNLKSREYLLGATVPVGAAGTVLASWIHRDDRLAGGTTGLDQYAVGYLHSLSKRTNLYTSWSRISADRAALDASRFNFGVRHRF